MARSIAVTKRQPSRRPVSGGAPAPGAVPGTLPAAQAPQLATFTENPPAGDEWLSELKLDGYRLLVWIERGTVRLVTRNGHDWTARMPLLASRFTAPQVATALIDGELVALRKDGSSHFGDLQAALSAGADRGLFFYAFDLLHLNGWDLRPCALIERKRLLEAAHSWGGFLRYTDHMTGYAADLRREACRLHLEGIVCKRADAPYRPGRTKTWLKVKCLIREEFVVLGWSPPGGSRKGIGSLALGFHDADGRLHYVGSVGTGFSDADLLALHARLLAMPSERPASLLLAGDPPDRQIRWVAPELVAEVSFTAWSGDGRMRHPVFLGLREDKSPPEVVMQVPDPDATRWEWKPLTIIRNPATAKPRRQT
jgi:bifunctional non-homologous end joining protein LigD